ncbi:MAG TPA: GGDEF domain-containing protein [Blastococcus sp.]
MQAERRTPSKLLALLYVLSGLLCLVGAANPMRPDTPVALLWTLGVVGSAGGAAIALLGARLRGWAIHAAVAFAGLLTALLAWRSATALGVVGLGPMLIALGLYAAHFVSLRAARLHAVMITVAASAGALAAKPSGFLMQWVVLVMSVLALTEVQGRLSERLRRAADTDPLTGLANRRAWEAEATRNLARAQRTGEPLSFAIIDLDGFKEVNDRDGHGAGDDLLRELTTGWARRLREADLLGRYGGDEFVLCLPATDEEGARELLEQLGATHDFPWSVGTATAQPGDSLASVLTRADARLYRRKRDSRAR